jgi:5-formaminoimidazole-4-carboxamide-1-beta-D-ribofuranosyl 5'-monophosphate synthetase
MKPPRDSRYLAWIRTLPCVVCASTRGIEASHTGPHGLGQKSSDFSAIPLCHKHHRTGKESYHKLGPQKFALTHDLNVVEIVRRLNTKPVIRIEAGAFVGYLENQQFRLGPTTEGIQPAVRKMIRLSSEDRLNAQVA